ncbi:MAG: TonB-dependent receptor [Acidobacteriaceae bacterium]
MSDRGEGIPDGGATSSRASTTGRGCGYRWFVVPLLLAASAGCHASQTGSAAPDSGASVQQLRQLSLQQLGNIKVTTFNKTPTELWDTPAAVYVLPLAQILRSGATTVADALRLVPGVEVGRISATTWAVGIRGLENNFSKSVLVLVDGRSVYTPLFAGVYWDVLDLPLRDIDHIEVIRGPGGTIWGPNAANGVINIITKSASETHGVMASGLAGTEDHTVDTLQIGSSAGKFNFRFYGRGFEREHEYHVDGINDDSWHQERVGFRGGEHWGANTWFVEGEAYRGDSPHIIGTSPVYDETSGGDLNFRWEHEQDNGDGLYLQAYVDRTLRTNTPLGESRNTIDIDFLQHFHIQQHNEFSYGGGLRWSPYHILSRYPTLENLNPAENTDHIYTGFVQDAVDLGARVKATVGAKLEENNYSGFDLQPSARLLWSIAAHQALWGGITRAVTTPSDLEEGFLLRGGGPSVYVQLTGNPHFKSEDVIGYEAGYRGLLRDRVYCDVSAFWNQYSNLQSFSAPAVTAAGGITTIGIEYENQIAGATNGFEIAPQVAILPGWQVNAGYSYLNSAFSASGPTSDISSTGSVNTYEHSTAKHSVFAQSLIDLPWRVEFDPMIRYASALPAQKVPAYITLDLHVAKDIGRNFVLEATGQNLLQPHHLEWGTGDPTQPPIGIERAGYVQLTFRPKP